MSEHDRESINLVELSLAIYTNGPADYKVPEQRVGYGRLRATAEVLNGRNIPRNGDQLAR
jgi:hypothetical protein